MPFKLPTTTPTPDELFDYWLGHPTDKLSHGELRALLYLVRRTMGFAKAVDAVSIKQFVQGIRKKNGDPLDHGCGLTNRTNLVHALDGLVAKQLVRRVKGHAEDGGSATTLYALWFEGDVPTILAQQSDDPRRGAVKAPPVSFNGTAPGAPVAPRGVLLRHPQETGPQETVDKMDTAPSSSSALWPAVLGDLRQSMTPDNYERWYAPTQVLSCAAGVLIVAVPDTLRRDYLESKGQAAVTRALRRLGAPGQAVRYVVA